MKRIFILIILTITPMLLTAQVWTKLDSTSAFINAIYVNDANGDFYVSSDILPSDFQQDNINFPNYGVGQNGFRIGRNMTSEFSDEILKDYSVFDFFSFPDNPKMMLATVRQFNEGGIVVSTDGGSTWDLSQIHCLTSSQIVKFASSGKSSSMIFGAETNSSKGLIFTYDTFNLCQTDDQFVINARDVKVSPFDSNLIFIGGNRSLRQIYRSHDRGITWLPDESGLEEKRVLCIMPSLWSAAVIYAGIDSLDYGKNSYGKGIYQSLDTGKTWKLIGASGKRVFALSQHPDNPKYIAAACDSGSVYFSGSWGYAWEEYSSGLPKEASVRTIAITPWGGNNSAVVLAGTYGFGLYKSNPVITDIDESQEGIDLISVTPMPFENNLIISISHKNDLPLRIEIFDILGNLYYNQTKMNTGEYVNLNLETNELLPGVYFIRLSDGKNIFTKKIIKQ